MIDMFKKFKIMSLLKVILSVIFLANMSSQWKLYLGCQLQSKIKDYACQHFQRVEVFFLSVLVSLFHSISLPIQLILMATSYVRVKFFSAL